jgi:diamine N-acetyltransferase
MDVRLATVGDVELIARLNESIQQFHCELVPEYFRPASTHAVVAALRELLAEHDTFCFVAWIDEKPVGYCLFKVVERDASAWATGSRRLHIDQLSVDSNWRRRGVGTLIMKTTNEFALEHNINEVVLDYWSRNSIARAFYKSLGFMPHTERVLLKISTATSDD